MKRGAAIGSWLAVWLALGGAAHAGGVEFPANDTEALGRGGAFTAKADDPMSVEYNVAGLARQRGTRSILDLNLVIGQLTFQRTGAYPDNPSDPLTPWGGRAYPEVRNVEAPFPAPLFALSTDFGKLRRWTFALAAYGPSAAGNRTYPLAVDRAPGPARYDFAQTRSLVVYPTLAVALHALRWLDVGAELQVVVGAFDFTSVSFVDLGRNSCPNVEYQPCDSTTHLRALGATATAAFGVMVRPARWLDLGLHARLPFTIEADGTVEASSPRVVESAVERQPAHFATSFPVVLRSGARLVFHDGMRESGDVEIDATWEAWGRVPETQTHIPKLSAFKNITSVQLHRWHDSYSVRAGGAFNLALPSGVLTARLGLFYDTSTSDSAYTRIDVDTLSKMGLTVGLGYEVRGFGIQLAYAYIIEPQRRVNDGVIRPTNGATQGSSDAATGEPLPAVNNGLYQGRAQILSLGLSAHWDELVQRSTSARR